MSNRQIGGKENVFPTFTDCFLMRNMSHQDVLKKVYQNAIQCVKYNKEVYRVNYGGYDDRISLECKDGSEYKADYVIVTVSIAILQKNLLRFSPELPPQKVEAINSIGIEPAGKLFLKFKQPIFHPDMKIIYPHFGNIFGWLSSDERSKSDYIFIFLIAGDLCSELDKNKDAYVNKLLAHLQTLTTKNVKEEFVDSLWQNWGSERLIQAGHSFDSIYQKSNARKIYA